MGARSSQKRKTAARHAAQADAYAAFKRYMAKRMPDRLRIIRHLPFGQLDQRQKQFIVENYDPRAKRMRPSAFTEFSRR